MVLQGWYNEKKRIWGFSDPGCFSEFAGKCFKKTKNLSPEIIVEPTCGESSILITAYKAFNPQKSLGIEIQKES